MNASPPTTVSAAALSEGPPGFAPANSHTLTANQWGMLSFLLSEVAFFTTLIVVYISYLHRDQVGPTPAEALSLPLVIGTTVCLLSSSLVIHLAERTFEHGRRGVLRWWSADNSLGITFLAGTAYEWRNWWSTTGSRSVATCSARRITRWSASTDCM